MLSRYRAQRHHHARQVALPLCFPLPWSSRPILLHPCGCGLVVYEPLQVS